jgi:membrane protease YdiL (CAAX protease family)
MSESNAQPVPAAGRGPVASKLHTLGFFLILLTIALISASSQRITHDPSAEISHRARLFTYAATFVASWALFFYVRMGIRRGGHTVGELIETAPQRGVAHWWKQFGVSLLIFAVWSLLAVVLNRLFPGNPAELQSLSKLLPHNWVERIGWIALSLTAGFCEEFEFRGYLQRQLGGWTGNASLGVVLQAVTFGAAHAYQSPRQMFIIAVLAVLLGVVAEWRKSLVPGMFFHAILDLLSGLLWQFARR